MKNFLRSLWSLAAILAIAALGAKAAGWPSSYEGVMLQGFYWDSYDDTKWTVLESQSDELAQFFKLIWIPNAAKSAASPSMGYDPVYWFTNYNSSFGTEEELRSMIATFKSKGVGIIDDVVLNHRCGVSNWTDFPAETWRGVTYQLGPEHICSDDEVKDQADQATPTGQADSGQSCSSARDLDHYSTTVQENCKAFCQFLLEDMGFAGFRLDQVKGYGGWATKLYNEASNPTFSVGEYYDGSYDACAAWIESTGKTSAAFDFPFKFAANDAFNNSDMTKLVWTANGESLQPAGLIHWWYPRLAVTFLDNHDTYRDDWNRINTDVMAANAFMLCSPGTPCVFLPHWQSHKARIKRLIQIRNAVGLNNQSAVNVLSSSTDCYMAEVTGTKGKLVVKVGSAWTSPDGYGSDQIVASGDNYCVWTYVSIPSLEDYTEMPSSFYILGSVNGNSWDPSVGVEMTADGNKFTADVEINGHFSFCKTLASSWDSLNAVGNRFGAANSNVTLTDGVAADASASGDPKAFTIEQGRYTITYDWITKTVTATSNNGEQSAIFQPEAYNEQPVEYYTLTGVRVESPGAGIYIRRQGGKVMKVVVK